MPISKLIVVITLSLFLPAASFSQPFYRDIQIFKEKDKVTPPPVNPILFIGSSSITNWKDLQQYFPTHHVLNRGFGGSSLPHLRLYAEDIIFRYHPKKIIIYCGENDFAASPEVTVDTVFTRFKAIFSLIRSRLPRTPIFYISMKPSPARRNLMTRMQEANTKIQTYLSTQKKTGFIDVFSAMLDSTGHVNRELFLSDSLHMNKKGYQIWQPLIESSIHSLR